MRWPWSAWLERRSLARLLGLCLTKDCGHEKAAHEHYRDGTDCSLCDCPFYR